jgi:hypothetical protein
VKIKCEREADAEVIAKAFNNPFAGYPSYRFTAVKWKRDRHWSIAVHCRATGALLKPTMEV